MKQRTSVGVSVIAGFALVLAACASSGPDPVEDQLEALREEVAQVVTDEARAEAILGQVDRMEELLVELGDLVSKHNDEIRAMARSYNTTRPEIEAAFATFLKERRRVAASLGEAHYQLKAQTTPDEWKKLAKKEKAALEWAASRNLGEAPLMDGGA